MHTYFANETIRNLFPSNDVLDLHFETCAVVGSNPTLSENKYGPSIDNNEFIIRINDAPVGPPASSFEVSGKRTSLRFFNEHRLRSTDKDSVFPLDLELGVLETESLSSSTAINNFYVERFWSDIFMKGLSQKKLWFMSPNYRISQHTHYEKMVENLGMNLTHLKELERAFYPSSGFQAILYSLQVCETTSLFGFSKLTPRPTPEASLGYYWANSFRPTTPKLSTNTANNSTNITRHMKDTRRTDNEVTIGGRAPHKGWVGHDFWVERWLIEAIQLQYPSKLKIY